MGSSDREVDRGIAGRKMRCVAGNGEGSQNIKESTAKQAERRITAED